MLLVCLSAFGAAGQKSGAKQPAAAEKSKNEDTQDEKKVRDIVAFLQYVLNTLGSNETPGRDKEVLVTESYTKIFRDEKVQVEDDLDEKRSTVTNKDVVAYLKDVDFFFRDVKFEFTIEKIEHSTMANGDHFYKVSSSRHLQGTGINGKEINNTIPRYIEINYDPDEQDLRIVSIYTNEISDKETLINWWDELSFEWQSVFKRKLNFISDSLSLDDIKNITAIEELNLSDNQYIQNIEPLAQLFNLRTLNIAGTVINDLTPIRNLTELTGLNIANTKVTDLTPLKYANKLSVLNISHTNVTDLRPLENLTQLQRLDLKGTSVDNFSTLTNFNDLHYLDLGATPVSDLSTIAELAALAELNISSTSITEINPLQGLTGLTILTIDSTTISDLGPLSNLENLEILRANHTPVADLTPLLKLPHLEKVYCDQTSITKDKAEAFLADNPNVLIIYDSKDLNNWWQTLPEAWQNVLAKAARASSSPTKEELARITNLDSVNVSGNAAIRDLEPLSRLTKLKAIIADKTSVKDLSPLKGLKEVKYVDVSETEVNDLTPLRQAGKLTVLRADQTKVESLDPLYDLKNLKEVYVDHTLIHDLIVRDFLEKKPGCLVVYKTFHLRRWWSNLPENWRNVFRSQMEKDTTSTRENLHGLVERKALTFNDAPVHDLLALSEFVNLKELAFSGTVITEIPRLDNIRLLRSLHATNSPLQKIESLALLTDLIELDIANTPIDDLKPLENLQNLQRLNCSGTQVKRLDPLEPLINLEYLDCSNTRVSQLDPVMHLQLKTLTCYNTKVSSREVESFKDSNPECQVIYYR